MSSLPRSTWVCVRCGGFLGPSRGGKTPEHIPSSQPPAAAAPSPPTPATSTRLDGSECGVAGSGGRAVGRGGSIRFQSACKPRASPSLTEETRCTGAQLRQAEDADTLGPEHCGSESLNLTQLVTGNSSREAIRRPNAAAAAGPGLVRVNRLAG